jgi:hypothetical protein
MDPYKIGGFGWQTVKHRDSGNNSLTFEFLSKLLSSHWEWRRILRELEVKIPEIRESMFRDGYGARERHLYEIVFYEGNIDIDDIRYELDKVKAYLDDVEKMLKR